MPSDNHRVPRLNKFLCPKTRLPLGLASCSVILCFALVANAAELRVRGRSAFRAVRVLPATDGIKVVGALRDESDAAISGALVAASDRGLQPCKAGSSTTSSDGEFCFMATGLLPAEVTLAFGGNDYFGPNSRVVPLVVRPLALDLTIELPSPRLMLNASSHRISVSVSGDVSTEERFEVHLSMARPSGTPETIAKPLFASPGQAAEFSVPSSALGAAGPAKLIAAIDRGDKTLAEKSLELLLVSTVQLDWEQVPTSACPSEGFESVVALSDGQGPVGDGFVEMTVGDIVVGMGEATNGSARIVSRFLPPRVESVTLRARYVSNETWRAAGTPITTRLRLVPPSPWRHIPWLALLVLAALWVIRGWHRPPSRQDDRRIPTPQRSSARIEVLTDGQRESGWVGHVIDAHTLDPIAGARITLRVPTIGANGTTWVETDAVGQFAMQSPGPLPEGTRLEIAASNHSKLVQPVPREGTLRIALTGRRRALLSHLVNWAGQMGRPWENGTATTPAAVAQTAQRGGHAAIQHWATKLEEATYGPADVTAAAEDELVSATPPLDRPDPLGR